MSAVSIEPRFMPPNEMAVTVDSCSQLLKRVIAATVNFFTIFILIIYETLHWSWQIASAILITILKGPNWMTQESENSSPGL